MRKLCYALYSLVGYLVFQAAALWGIAFTGGFVPEALQPVDLTPAPAVLVNLALLGLFGVQHSVMARSSFKGWSARYVPQPIERSTYVLLASLTLALLFWLWQPLPGMAWEVRNPTGQALLWALFGLGWVLVGVSTFLIDHAALAGLRQVWGFLRRTPPAPMSFSTPTLYKLVRHPMMLGFLIAFWATPQMRMGHLLFAAGMTIYILIGVAFEERDLLRSFGATYRAYQQRVPMLLPLPWRRISARDVERADSR
jgi:methanethiol S-methyltransferase